MVGVSGKESGVVTGESVVLVKGSSLTPETGSGVSFTLRWGGTRVGKDPIVFYTCYFPTRPGSRDPRSLLRAGYCRSDLLRNLQGVGSGVGDLLRLRVQSTVQSRRWGTDVTEERHRRFPVLGDPRPCVSQPRNGEPPSQTYVNGVCPGRGEVSDRASRYSREDPPKGPVSCNESRGRIPPRLPKSVLYKATPSLVGSQCLGSPSSQR